MSKICYNVITFPGSNCDHDAFWIAKLHNAKSELIWHKDDDLKNPDVVIIPGGFSYGDYLRCGAIAKFSSIMKTVVDFADKGGLVIGICNGFQILTETQLLPGTLLMNNTLHFICQHQYVKVENNNTPFTNKYNESEVLDIPIAHKEGNYFIDEPGLKKLRENNQIVFRYCDENGQINNESNPNGSVYNIAGIVNEKGNVLGMMPHPERAAETILSSHRGAGVFESINNWVYENL